MFGFLKFPATIKVSCILLVFIFLSAVKLTAAESKPIAVVGFINLGNKAEDNINMVISKSLITFLSRIPDVDIVPFSEVEKIAKQNNFWSAKSLDVNDAADIGLLLKAKQIVTGDYTINKTDNTVIFNIMIYDPVTSKLNMQRQFKGNGGADIFDTIDRMIRSTSSLLVGRNLILGKLKVDVKPEGNYKLYVNGRIQKEIDNKSGFLDNVVADENMEVSIRTGDSGKEKEVYRDFITVKENEICRVNFVTNMTLSAVKPASGKTLFSERLYPVNSLFAYFPFISNTLDESGSTNHAAAAKVMLTNDRFGNVNSAYYFPGKSGNKVELAKAVNKLKSFTLLLWFKNDPDSIGEIIGINGSFLSTTLLYVSSIGELVFGVFTDEGAGRKSNILQTQNKLLDNTWHFIGCSLDNKRIAIYLDGRLVSESQNKEPSSYSGKWIIGNGMIPSWSPQYTGNDYKGTIDDAWIYTNVVSDEDISNIYENTKP